MGTLPTCTQAIINATLSEGSSLSRESRPAADLHCTQRIRPPRCCSGPQSVRITVCFTSCYKNSKACAPPLVHEWPPLLVPWSFMPNRRRTRYRRRRLRRRPRRLSCHCVSTMSTTTRTRMRVAGWRRMRRRPRHLSCHYVGPEIPTTRTRMRVVG